MNNRHEFKLDVTEAVPLGEQAQVAVSVHLPDVDKLPAKPVVCFAKPGGGYSRGYYSDDLPGSAKGAQAEWHRQRGWIFVSVDHLGVGDSSLHAPELLDYTNVAAGNYNAEQQILQRLADGTLVEGFPAIPNPLKIGIGQSMGGCMTIIQQGRYHCYDGIGILGYSAVHNHPPHKPGTQPIVAPWLPRDTLLKQPMVMTNAKAVHEYMSQQHQNPNTDKSAMTWGFHYDDVDPEFADADMAHFARGIYEPSAHEGFERFSWSSFTVPGAVAWSCLTPGAVAPEAAAVSCPVLVALGERDVSVDPPGEIRAYKSASSIDYYICPRMGHMHNFASTREIFWKRIENWVDWVITYDQDTPR